MGTEGEYTETEVPSKYMSYICVYVRMYVSPYMVCVCVRVCTSGRVCSVRKYVSVLAV